MKTLDEVIKAYEYCVDDNYRDCRGCPYGCEDGESGCTNAEEKTDALHYLKEYQKDKQIYSYDIARRILDVAERNDPLTWEQLKQMEGKPVWVEDNIDEPEDLTKYWAIYRRIEKTQETEYALLCDLYYDKAQYGETWQAYSKERR